MFKYNRFLIKKHKLQKMTRLPYHMVELSPWPMTSAMSAMFIALGLINWFHFNSQTLLYMGMASMGLSVFQWWRDIIREATYMGKHTSHVQSGLKLGMLLFIISEICFFFAFFWAFFHSSLTPTVEIGCMWPPLGIVTINPMGVPLLNTIILLSSGFTVTWAHHSLMMQKRNMTSLALIITVLLGIYFTVLQMTEYIEASFTIADSIYGSTFFVMTGFHGVHVMIGTIFLMVGLLRNVKLHFSSKHHVGLEMAAWYWHFVDVVWIYLYIFVYWWGSL